MDDDYSSGNSVVGNLALAIGVILAVGSSGCSSMSVSTDFDASAAFSSYKTYAWLSQETGQPTTLVGKRIEIAVDENLKAKGFTKVTSGTPDMLVTYRTGSQEQAEVDSAAYAVGPWGGAWGGWGGVDVYQYTEGQLQLDFVDPAKKQLVWRGIADAVVGDTAPDQEKITEAVDKILASFPPESK